MRREPIAPRSSWREIVESQGFTYHTNDDGSPYWTEQAYYRFASDEVDELEAATSELYSLCLVAVDHLLRSDRLDAVGIPRQAWPQVRLSWERREPTLYGRFDLAYDGSGPPKMLEFNADTPTTIVEAAVVQWYWMQDVFPSADQFNSVWEGLVETWTELRRDSIFGETVHFVTSPNDEDWMTIRMLRDTAEEAGLHTAELFMRDIGWHPQSGGFVDLESVPMHTIFKLYPWEWMLKDAFGNHALETYDRVQWIEPLWKAVASSKGMLPVLWELYPDHPNLLPAFADGPRDMTEFVTKPIVGREGANVCLHTSGGVVEMPGQYGGYPRVYQQRCKLYESDGRYAVVGSWVVGGEPRGIGIRESATPITVNFSGFAPHVFD